VWRLFLPMACITWFVNILQVVVQAVLCLYREFGVHILIMLIFFGKDVSCSVFLLQLIFHGQMFCIRGRFLCDSHHMTRLRVDRMSVDGGGFIAWNVLFHVVAPCSLPAFTGLPVTLMCK
jgi:hypothetical protein